jgi:hypothetical protein
MKVIFTFIRWAIVGLFAIFALLFLVAITPSRPAQSRMPRRHHQRLRSRQRRQSQKVRKAIPVTKAEKDCAAIEALGSKREVSADYNTDTVGDEAIERIDNADKDDEVRYTISSTGKRHNSTCRYYGKGRLSPMRAPAADWGLRIAARCS